MGFESDESGTILFILDIGPTETHINYLKCGSRINKKHTPGSPVAVFDIKSLVMNQLPAVLVHTGFNYFQNSIYAGFNLVGLVLTLALI